VRMRVLISILRPEGCEIETWKTLGKHQRMIVEVILLTRHPARELRALLERGVALAKKVRFRNAHLFQGGSHRRPGPFTYTDDADGLTFDQGDPQATARVRAMPGRDDAGGEPSGGTAANDADRSNRTYHD